MHEVAFATPSQKDDVELVWYLKFENGSQPRAGF